jgi:GT2 family glycosyltransferase
MGGMDLSVLSVTWNSSEHVLAQIRSVRGGCRRSSCEQLVFDNASSDGTAALVAETFPDVKLTASDRNVGFGAANNVLARAAHGEFLLLLNPDTRVEEGALDALVAWGRSHPRAGIVGCRLVDERGKFHRDTAPRRFPRVVDRVTILLKLHRLVPSLLDWYLWRDFDDAREQQVDSVQGSCLLLRRDVYERLGRIFDPRYFIWFEDVDLCREVRELGYEVWYTPVASCVDFRGRSFAKRPALWKEREFTRSMLQYSRKWERWHSWIWIALLRPFAIALAWAHDLLLAR